MSKERLEVIKEIFDIHKLQTFSDRETVPFNIKDIEWLIEQAGRVQELEEDLTKYRNGFEFQLLINNSIKKQNKRYREALEEIRNYGTYELNNALKTGHAWIAHEALEEDNEPLRAEVSE